MSVFTKIWWFAPWVYQKSVALIDADVDDGALSSVRYRFKRMC